MSFRFQVDLRGIIELLSNHLYATPEVYLRELLQNAVDAITARRRREPGHRGAVRVEIQEKADGGPTSIVIHDDGVGLVEDEVHALLATIGESSKRGPEAPRDFLGQFGIGLLSCFVVSDEIVVVTRAAGSAPVMWRGRSDGTYEVAPYPEPDMPQGTRVHLRARRDAEPLLQRAKVVELAARYGGLLPYPVTVQAGDVIVDVNGEAPPFRRAFADEASRRRAALAYGEAVFGVAFLDAVFLRSEAGDVEGVAFVLPHTTTASARRADRVYLKGMLLGDSAEALLPRWGFFVRCVVDARALRPTAARDAFYEDDTLAHARAALGAALSGYLRALPARDEVLLRQVIGLHGLALKEICLVDDDLYRTLADFFPFQTTLGEATLGALRRAGPLTRYVASLDGYREIAQIAAAEGLAIVNAGYVHDAAILERLPQVFPGHRVEAMESGDLARAFHEVGAEALEDAARFLRAADAILVGFRCVADLKRFSPSAIPVLYTVSPLAAFRRSARRTSEAAQSAWGAVLDRIAERGDAAEAYARLTFNFDNPLVRTLVASAGDRALLRLAVRALYTQALLLGHHPLDAAELAAMNESLVGLVTLAARASGGAS